MELRGRVAFGFAAGAVIYSVALIAFVVAIPSVDGETLLSYGGWLSLAITIQPLIASSLLFVVLRHRCSTGSTPAIVGAWIFGALYFVWSVIAGFSLAAGAMPAALLLLFAIGLTPRPAESQAPLC